jgi:hypothetical protein
MAPYLSDGLPDRARRSRSRRTLLIDRRSRAFGSSPTKVVGLPLPAGRVGLTRAIESSPIEVEIRMPLPSGRVGLTRAIENSLIEVEVGLPLPAGRVGLTRAFENSPIEVEVGLSLQAGRVGLTRAIEIGVRARVDPVTDEHPSNKRKGDDANPPRDARRSARGSAQGPRCRLLFQRARPAFKRCDIFHCARLLLCDSVDKRRISDRYQRAFNCAQWALNAQLGGGLGTGED